MLLVSAPAAAVTRWDSSRHNDSHHEHRDSVVDASSSLGISKYHSASSCLVLEEHASEASTAADIRLRPCLDMARRSMSLGMSLNCYAKQETNVSRKPGNWQLNKAKEKAWQISVCCVLVSCGVPGGYLMIAAGGTQPCQPWLIPAPWSHVRCCRLILVFLLLAATSTLSSDCKEKVSYQVSPQRMRNIQQAIVYTRICRKLLTRQSLSSIKRITQEQQARTAKDRSQSSKNNENKRISSSIHR